VSATFAEAMEGLAFRLNIYDDLEAFAAAATTGWVDLIGTAKADINSDFAASAAASYEADREAAAVIVDGANVATGIGPFMADIAQQTGSVALSAAEQFRDLFDYMIANSQTVNSRSFTFGTPAAAGGNTGDGEILRCTTDDRAYQMQGWFPDAFTLECVEDSNQLGVQFEEVLLLRGATESVDNLQRSGSGIEEEIACWSERNTETYVQNPSFENFGGTTPTAGSPQTPTSLAGWTVTSGAFTNLQVQVDQLWRTPPGSTKSISLTFTANETISQDLVAVNGTEIDQDVPYAVGVAVYRRSSCDGTLTITLGGVNRAVTMSGLANNAWTWVWFVASPDANNWYQGFKSNNLTLSYALSGRSTGQLVLDGGLFGPFTLAGGAEGTGRGAMGTYVFARSGQTPFVGGAGGLTGDRFTWTDTEDASRAKNQFWLATAGVGYLPALGGGSETIADK